MSDLAQAVRKIIHKMLDIKNNANEDDYSVNDLSYSMIEVICNIRDIENGMSEVDHSAREVICNIRDIENGMSEVDHSAREVICHTRDIENSARDVATKVANKICPRSSSNRLVQRGAHGQAATIEALTPPTKAFGVFDRHRQRHPVSSSRTGGIRHLRPLPKGEGGLVERGTDGEAAAIQDVGVNHSGFDIFVTEQLLNGSNIIAGFEQVGGEGMTQRMWPDRFG